MENTPEGFEPDSLESVESGLPPTAAPEQAEADATSELLEAAEELQDDEQEIERKRQEYEAAKEKMTSKVRELRSSLKFRLERMKDESEREQLVETEAASLASTFSHSEQMSILKKLLPHRADADTAKEKFAMIIELGLQMPYWSTDNFNHAYQKKFGKRAEAKLDAEAEELYAAVRREFPELEELEEAA